MNQDDVKFIDEVVTQYRQALLDVGYLSRTNLLQRQRLSKAHSLVLSLPALARERFNSELQAEMNKLFRREAEEQTESL